MIGESENVRNNEIMHEHKSMKALGLKKFRHTKGSAMDMANQFGKEKLKNLKKEEDVHRDIKKKKIKKIKREQFKKWWSKNSDKVKKRKALRRRRPY